MMNHVLRWITAGESHGPALVALVEGMVAGVEVTSSDIAAQLARRRLGYGRGARMKFEADKVTILGGVRHGRTQAGPVAIEIGNTEWPKWEQVMSADPVDQELLDGMARNAPLTRPRPGHADYSGMLKYGFDDARPVLERASAARRRPGSRPVPSPATSCARPSAPRWSAMSSPSARPSRTPARPRRAPIWSGSTHRPSAPSTRLRSSR
ncbi:hypothetical protein MTP03_29510 [Tsukamurella sp. PLM1]|nr:hypothetical protein MTP03_29510 [Tsukamurella sp. PLM1]